MAFWICPVSLTGPTKIVFSRTVSSEVLPYLDSLLDHDHSMTSGQNHSPPISDMKGLLNQGETNSSEHQQTFIKCKPPSLGIEL